jgi:hypothetical protein
METFTRDEFQALLLKAVECTRSRADRDLAEPLPPATLLVLDAFGQWHRASSVDEVLTYLYTDGTFPLVIVVGLWAVDGQALVALLPSGDRYTNDRALTLNQPPAMGPFNCVGLMLRGTVWERPRPLTPQDLVESAASWA